MKKRIENALNIPRLKVKYRAASRQKRTRLLNEICDLTGMHRKALIRLLNRKIKRTKPPRGLAPKYQYETILPILKTIWFACDQMGSKRLHTAIPFWLPFYEQEHGSLMDFTRLQLLSTSPATIDRLLKKTRVRHSSKRLCGTKPGKILKNQIPIKLNQWDEHEPGFLEADTVAHFGTSLEGDFVWSITFTDIHTTWTENRAIWNKGATGVVQRVKEIELVLPFKIKGFDCDNGSEFLNHHLLRYFTDRPKERMVQFTRSRPYHKNDNAHVEQKNWTHVRQLLGYDRLDHPKLVGLVNDLYEKEWRLYQKHFIPTLKCIKKEKINSKYRKQYDTPKTPYERVLACESIEGKVKQRLMEEHQPLNPFQLKRDIEKKLSRIFKYVKVAKKVKRRI
ncbi:MAG: integrase [Pseudomonadota bacterium]|nr:transposase family protein [Gammaproteobacteria bacterium]MBU1559021.1 transposase family protein [Gammaproteobacteria bacterium]MBU1629162.1 transposase family protein [Gammaproteobacteria bacterium]MBU1926355.1 transposase family protein [Gammaproteobacteria bacterium]